jgi:anti-sigma regulatory factor (Ser/Thr protein kinase)
LETAEPRYDPEVPAIELPGDRSGAARARHFVADLLSSWGVSDALIDDCRLLVSELVTNAVLHARSAPRVDVDRRDGGVRVAVSDTSAARPRVLDGGPYSAAGRGMMLVDRIASRWGVDPLPDGKSVWFELEIPAVPAP